MSFIYCITNPGMEDWLKAEVQLRKFPLTPSFQKKGYLTFKCLDEHFSAANIEELAFARSWGDFIARGPVDSQFTEEAGLVYEQFQQSTQEVWRGSRRPRSYLKKDFPQLVTLDEYAREAPSRTYFKTKEALELIGCEVEGRPWALEIGSAPGGSSQCLIEAGYKVVGVDPGQMSASLVENIDFKWMKQPVQTVEVSKLPVNAAKIELLSIDLNLGPREVLRELKRLMPAFLQLKYLLLILKTPKKEMAQDVLKWKAEVEGISTPLDQFFYLQLPSHRKEVCLVGVKGRKSL
jgi:hypothetical protein